MKFFVRWLVYRRIGARDEPKILPEPGSAWKWCSYEAWRKTYTRRLNACCNKICRFSLCIWFCYAGYNSPKFNGFINCTFWSIIVVITLGKGAHRTPSGVRERHTCIGLFKVKKFLRKHLFQSWTSEHRTYVSWISRSRIFVFTVNMVDKNTRLICNSATDALLLDPKIDEFSLPVPPLIMQRYNQRNGIIDAAHYNLRNYTAWIDHQFWDQ
jgi:hypothetical protein